jgi:uncharacterized protein YukE
MSTFANVYIGSAPNDGTGDPLRNAFDKINHNFSNIAGGNSGAVTSVAGRTGDIALAVNDVLGAASTVYARSYTMGNTANWNAEVNTISSALDQLAQRLRAAGF